MGFKLVQKNFQDSPTWHSKHRETPCDHKPVMGGIVV